MLTTSMREILPQDYRFHKLNPEPFVFLEGPVWDKRRGRLYFSDPLAQTILEMDEPGRFRVVCTNTGYANGMCLNERGNLAVCRMETGTLEEVCPETGRTLGVLAEGYGGRPFGATNDAIADGRGGYYITDPVFLYGPKAQELEATYYRAPDGRVLRAATDSGKPNGLAFSPDQRWLYIDDTADTAVWRYRVQPDGALTDGSAFLRLSPPQNADALPEVQRHGEADGMKVDSAGNIYVTTYSGIQVFNEDGVPLGAIPMPGEETAANCVFGGADLRTLYITARTSLYSVRLLISGI